MTHPEKDEKPIRYVNKLPLEQRKLRAQDYQRVKISLTVNIQRPRFGSRNTAAILDFGRCKTVTFWKRLLYPTRDRILYADPDIALISIDSYEIIEESIGDSVNPATDLIESVDRKPGQAAPKLSHESTPDRSDKVIDAETVYGGMKAKDDLVNASSDKSTFQPDEGETKPPEHSVRGVRNPKTKGNMQKKVKE